MIARKETIVCLAMGLILLAGVSGCVSTKRAAVVIPTPTCSEAIYSGMQNLSDSETVELLDEAEAVGDMDGCWIPVVTHSLEENRDIPRRHLVKAVKVFNKRRYEEQFHKAMYRYFAELSKQPDTYRSEDREVLEDYCSYLINNADTRRNERLNQAKLLCRRLDKDLYAKLFE